jgi:PKD domain
VPKANFAWSFGDGTTAGGPSVVHSYTQGGTFTVTLKVTDRGANVTTATQQVAVLGPSGESVLPPVISPPTSKPSSGGAKPALSLRVALMPQGLKGILRSGVALTVTVNQSANGMMTLSIPRAAKRAHITAGRGPSVVIGRRTVSGIHSGSNHLHVHLSKTTAAKLKRVGHVTLSIRLALVAPGGHRITVGAAGHY